MQRLRTVTSLDVSAVAGHHAMPAALLFIKVLRSHSKPVNKFKLCFAEDRYYLIQNFIEHHPHPLEIYV